MKIRYKEDEFLVESTTQEETFFWNNFLNDKWESNTLDFLTRYKRAGHFLDIGSWIGPVSLLMAKYYTKVISVDFDPVANKKFKKNIDLNNITNIELHSIGLSNIENEIEIDGNNLGLSTTNIFENQSRNKIQVKLMKFVDFIHSIPDHNRISFIKIDCEGSEYLFLDQVYSYIKNRKVIVNISYHPWVIKRPKYYVTKLYHWLNQLPFRRYYFSHNGGGVIIKEPYCPLFKLHDKFPMADVIESY